MVVELTGALKVGRRKKCITFFGHIRTLYKVKNKGLIENRTALYLCVHYKVSSYFALKLVKKRLVNVLGLPILRDILRMYILPFMFICRFAIFCYKNTLLVFSFNLHRSHLKSSFGVFFLGLTLWIYSSSYLVLRLG